MNFSEKLIKLRKEKGLSQEELGYKLNVTRQTVSKWELGQTTPEMDKLIEMSKIFGTTVDELVGQTDINSNPITETSQIEDGAINDKPVNKRNLKPVIVIIIVIIVASLLIGGIITYKIWNFGTKMIGDIFNLGKDMSENIVDTFNNTIDVQEEVIDKATDVQDEMLEQATNTINNAQENINNSNEDISSQLESFLNDVQSNIQNENYVKTDEEFEVKRFNNSFEIFAGTAKGVQVIHVMDSIITSNKTQKDKLITVTYKDTSTTDPVEIKNLKSTIDKYGDYEISYEYNENGYIYMMTIE